MCGWVGAYNPYFATSELLITTMTKTLEHRGPDDSGIWTDSEAGVAFGFRRLAIVDLSAAGHQPMASASGRYMLVFNGEVYNFASLRKELEPLGYKFRGHSDTEVMLAAIEEWGLKRAAQRFVGMFAFALWDRQKRELALVRDRLGIKPLYYAVMNGTVLFGSELKALRAHPHFRPEIDRDAVTAYMRYGYVPSPLSIYKGVSQVQPGTMLTIQAAEPGRVIHDSFWSLQTIAEAGVANPAHMTDQEAIGQLDTLLRDAVKLRMIADVPLGAFLSGGVDSSLVVALMQAQHQQPIKTFSIGFEDAAYNESGYARAVAEHLGTDHTDLCITAADAQAIIPRLPDIYDEPFADPSQIPTLVVSELARQQVTVSLSGDGGDELFAGYDRYSVTQDTWRKLRLVPSALRHSLRAGGAAWRSFDAGNGRTPRQLERLVQIGGLDSADDLYRYVVSQWKTPVDLVVGGSEPMTYFTHAQQTSRLSVDIQRMMYVDMLTYLPDDILTKVDRATMAVGLEARVPLLDHRVVEFAWQLPLSLKVRGKQRKWILRQVLDRYVPRQLIERPKMGFGVPLEQWLRGPLRAWAEELLEPQRLRGEGFFRPEPIRAMWAEHLAERRNNAFYLWNVLMFQMWLERWNTTSTYSGDWSHDRYLKVRFQ